MARVPDIKRIQKENFDKDDQDMIEQLAFPLNSFMEQTRSALEGRLDNTNLNQEFVTVTVKVDANGKVQLTTKYKSKLRTGVAGHVVIGAFNKTDSTVFPTATPFITYTQVADIVQIFGVTGLQADNEYRLTVLSIGK